MGAPPPAVFDLVWAARAVVGCVSSLVSCYRAVKIGPVLRIHSRSRVENKHGSQSETSHRTSGENGLASLRLQIEGSWSVEEFQSLLLTLDDVYKRVATVMTLGELLRQEQRQNENLQKEERYDRIDWSLSELYGGTVYPYGKEGFYVEREPFSRVVAGVQPFVSPLGVDAIRLQSPGWLQIVGNLNPLKVIADFISKWRTENTKRMQIKTTTDTERERFHTESALERERMLRGFALELLRQLPEGQRAHHAGRLAEVAEYAITPATSALQRVASDARVLEAEVVNVGRLLPQEPPPISSPKPRQSAA